MYRWLRHEQDSCSAEGPWAAASPRALLFVLILLAAAGTRFWRLDHFSYGFDEILQTYFVQGTWGFFWASLKFDAVHPPLDYVISRSLEAFQPADWVRKIPAVAWGLGTIASLSLLLWRRAAPAAGLFTALFLAVAPFHVRYSQELRPYSLGLFFLCLSVLLLDFLLARPSWRRLVAFYISCLATLYTLYLAGLVLGIASLGLLITEAVSGDEGPRKTARRFLAWSPVFGLMVLLAYLPWLPVVLEASRRPSPVLPPPLSWERLARSLSFFAFAPDDGQPLGRKGPIYLVLVAVGLLIVVRRPRLRFLAVWFAGGALAIEALEHLHPHWYVTRHYLPAGIVVPALAALPVTELFQRPKFRLLAGAVALIVVVFSLRSLAVYFREGRPDWRTLGNYLRTRPSSERIFTENQYSQLCVAFYTVGPGFLFQRGRSVPEVYSLEREPVRLAWSWLPETTAWLVLAGPPPDEPLREWSRFFPTMSFPKAEGAILRRLDPALWDRMVATVPKPPPKP